MATRAAVKNKKKPMDTPLGKAPHMKEAVPDFSHVRKPIDTNIFGLRQVLQLVQTSTDEVKNYITYECDIMYECKMCRTIFRSLANFILHKRNYCTEKYNPVDHTNCRNNCQENNFYTLEENMRLVNETNGISRPATPDQSSSSDTQEQETPEKDDQKVGKNLKPVIDKLIERHNLKELARAALTEDLSKEVPNYSKTVDHEDNVCLQKIENSDSAVFQTMFKNIAQKHNKYELMKNEVMEIHGILDSDEAVLGPDGKICNFQTSKHNEKSNIPKNDLICTECDLKFSTKKTLTYHIKYKHNLTRIVYICPECKDSFANNWCVYRHLYKVHRKTSTQIRRMRDQIYNSAVRKDQEPSQAKKKDKNKDLQEKTDDENQWMKNIEGDNDLQMCGGCGKRFERKAALYSHSQMCMKRIAVCNTIKENNAKREQEEKDKNKSTKQKESSFNQPRGSSKRKPNIIRMYKQIEIGEDNKATKPTDVEANKDKGTVEEELDAVSEPLSVEHKDNYDYDEAEEDQYSTPLDVLDTESMLNIIGVVTPNCQKNHRSGSECSNNSTDEQFEEMDGIKPLPNQISFKKDKEVNIEQNDCTKQSNNFYFTNSESSTSSQKEEPDFKGYSNDLIIDKSKNKQKENNELIASSNSNIDNVTVQLNKTIVPEPNFYETCKETSINVINIPSSLNKNSNENTFLNEIYEPKKNLEISDSENVVFNSDNRTTNSPFNEEIKNFDDNSILFLEENCRTEESPILISSSSSEENISDSYCNEIINNSEQEDEQINNKYKTFDLPLSVLNHFNKLPNNNENKFCKVTSTANETSVPRRTKRKRTLSLDHYVREKKNIKLSVVSDLSETNDVNFISKAAPYMNQTNLSCISCEINFSSMYQLLWHMSDHFSWFRFQCTRCAFMSFSKYDCVNHAKKVHLTPQNLMDRIVLPIPNWKTVLMSHDFNYPSVKFINEIDPSSQEEIDTEIEETESKEDKLETSSESTELFHGYCISDCTSELESSDKSENTTVNNKSIDVNDSGKDSIVSTELIYPSETFSYSLEPIENDINESPRISNIAENKVKLKELANKKSKCIAKLDFKKSDSLVESTSEQILEDTNITTVQTNVRPVRNRQRSVKVLQSDFLYDLKDAIKINEAKSNVLNNKVKKSSSAPKRPASRSSVSSTSLPLRVYTKKTDIFNEQQQHKPK